MSDISMPTTAAATISVRPLPDPVIEALGHDPRSVYVESFWLGILGPTSTFLLRRIAYGFDAAPDGFTFDIDEAGHQLGVSGAGKNSPLRRSIDRLCNFGQARMIGDELYVLRKVPTLPLRLARHLTEPLRAEHDAFLAALTPRPVATAVA